MKITQQMAFNGKSCLLCGPCCPPWPPPLQLHWTEGTEHSIQQNVASEHKLLLQLIKCNLLGPVTQATEHNPLTGLEPNCNLLFESGTYSGGKLIAVWILFISSVLYFQSRG